MFEVIIYDMRGEPTRELITFSLIAACGVAFYTGQDYKIRKLENYEVYIESKAFNISVTEKAKERILKELLRVNKQFLTKQCGFTTLRSVTAMVDDLLTAILQ